MNKLSADFNPSPDTPSKEVVTSFFAAAEGGDAATIQELLDFFPVLAEWKEPLTQATALIVAAKAGRTEVIAVLVQSGADIKAEDAGAMNALSYAACNGHYDVCVLLIQSGADPAEKGRHGMSAIDCARTQDFPSLGDYMLRAAAERRENIKASWGDSGEIEIGTSRPVQAMKPIVFKPKS
ncbi:MAG: ankyrin repeat domain-containing protein [Alphaproteobacteria bacterium]|nr:MAG: ankyrin repeat domain-containing protein [Alphaproteobacteria bacterium]